MSSNKLLLDDQDLLLPCAVQGSALQLNIQVQQLAIAQWPEPAVAMCSAGISVTVKYSGPAISCC
jgi:hypothetical protein